MICALQETKWGGKKVQIQLIWIMKTRCKSTALRSGRQEPAGSSGYIQNTNEQTVRSKMQPRWGAVTRRSRSSPRLSCSQLHIYNCASLSVVYLRERPGELHVLGGGVAALQQPGPAVHVHQTLVVVVVDRRTQHSQVELLGAGVVHILLGDTDTPTIRPQRLKVRKTSRGGNTRSAPAVFFHELCKTHKIKVCCRGFLDRAALVPNLISSPSLICMQMTFCNIKRSAGDLVSGNHSDWMSAA